MACDLPARTAHIRPGSTTVISRRSLLAASALTAIAPNVARAAANTAPYGAVPSPRQLRWHSLETTAFLHFGLNTFTNKEWGYGDEDPNLFQPAAFDPDAIVSALAAAGMKGAILTCKHHDGFCLWPSATTSHNISAGSWQAGKGDVVRAISDACRHQKLAFGVYLSPWDRNNAAYGAPEYIQLYRRQLTELLTGYGEIFEVWHDGANGGDGFYGGAREKRTIDKRTYYDWPKTWELVRSLQPNAVIFSDVGPDIRWVGNERGIAGDPCWAAYDPVGADGGAASPGDVRERESPIGTRHGSRWLPAECDVSIRPGWFWHPAEDARVKTLRQLIDLYYVSAGRGANLLLNVPPNRDGLIATGDAAVLKAFGDYRRATFGRNLAERAKLRWSVVDGVPAATLDLSHAATFSVIRLREDIRLGQRIDAVELDRWTGSAWEPVAAAASVGARRLIRLPAPVTASRLRLRVTKSAAPPVLSDLALFAEPPGALATA